MYNHFYLQVKLKVILHQSIYSNYAKCPVSLQTKFYFHMPLSTLSSHISTSLALSTTVCISSFMFISKLLSSAPSLSSLPFTLPRPVDESLADLILNCPIAAIPQHLKACLMVSLLRMLTACCTKSVIVDRMVFYEIIRQNS